MSRLRDLPGIYSKITELPRRKSIKIADLVHPKRWNECCSNNFGGEILFRPHLTKLE